MHGSFIFFAFCAVVAAQKSIVQQASPLFSFSGSFAETTPNTSTGFPIFLDQSTGECGRVSLNTTRIPFATLEFTFPTPGVRALYSYGGNYIHVIDKSSLFSYNPSDLCAGNFVFPLVPTQANNSLYQYGHFFRAATYVFLLFGSNGKSFIGQIWDGVQGQTSNSTTNSTWHAATGETCAQDAADFLYDTQVVRVNSSAYYDVYLTFGQNREILPYQYQIPQGGPSFTLLRGNYSGADLRNETCTSLNYVASAKGEILNVQGFNLWLKSDETYTFVVSGGFMVANNSFLGQYSLTVAPSGYRQFTNTTKFSRPTAESCNQDSTCVDNECPALPQAYASSNFSVPKNALFYLWTKENDDRDLQFYLYSEPNAGSETIAPQPCGTSRQTCFDGQDRMPGKVYNSGSQSVYSIVATNRFDNSYGSEASFSFYVLSGEFVDISKAPTRSPTVAPTDATKNPTIKKSSQVSNAFVRSSFAALLSLAGLVLA